jgi:hypothetical protein
MVSQEQARGETAPCGSHRQPQPPPGPIQSYTADSRPDDGSPNNHRSRFVFLSVTEPPERKQNRCAQQA